jgi:putative chitinase
MISRDVLSKLCPRPKDAAKGRIWDGYVNALASDEGADLLQKFGVTTSIRIAHALAQWAHESGGFTLIWESGAYSAERIMQIFGVGKHSAKVTASEAKALAYNGPALFDRVYGIGNPRKAAELGNKVKGDGWRFRGCGIVQITGRGAHERYAAKIGCSLDDLQQPINSIHAALLEWQEKGCNKAADKDDIQRVTKLVNGGQNGIADRRVYLAKAKKLLANVTLDAPHGPVSIGDEGRSVKELQELLVRAGYVIPVDGIHGKRTEGAIAAFQVNNGLPGTGVADQATWELLKKAEPMEQREVSAEDLVKKGERSVWILRIGKSILKWLGFGGIGAAMDGAATGGATISGALEGLEAGRQTVSQVSSFLGWGLTWPGILIAIGVLFGVGIYWLFDYLEKRRVADAQVGANLSI